MGGRYRRAGMRAVPVTGARFPGRQRGAAAVLVVAGVLAVDLAGAAPGCAASFRPLERLPPIPVEVGTANERAMMQADIDRLAGRAVDIETRRRLYERDCGGAAFGASGQRDCQFRLVDLRRDASRFNTDAYALDVYFGRVAGEIASRRLAGDGAGAAVAPAPVGRRLDHVREALAEPGASWAASLAHIRALFVTRTGDAALRDAVAYLEAMQRGAIAAVNLENPYYRHGVRRFLAGDDWSAALAFARSARDDPADDLVFASYARAVRRQHAGPECVKAGRCVGGDVAGWATRFGAGQAAAAKALLAAAGREESGIPVRDAANRLRGFAIYAAKAGAPGSVPASATAQAVSAAGHVRAGDWAAAADAWTDAWRLADPVRAASFLAIYADGASAAAGESGPPDIATLRAALSRADADPFSGALTTAQIVRLQR